MKTLTVDLPGRAYDILIQRGLLDQAGARIRAILPRASRLFVVTDTNVLPLYHARVRDALREAGFQTQACAVPAGEASKSAGQLSDLWERMMAFGLTPGGLCRRHRPPGGGFHSNPHHPPGPGGLLRGGQSGHRPPGREEPGRGLLAAEAGPHGPGHPGHPGRPDLR